ncbi:MAG: hypothetical protein ABH950_09925 [Candidatus Altiarchaeota archaeon]
MDNEQLYEQARNAIEELFSDTSVSQEKAMENLQSLISEIQSMVEALKEDMKNQ